MNSLKETEETEEKKQRAKSDLSIYFSKMRGGDRPSYSQLRFLDHFLTGLGSFLGIGIVGILNVLFPIPLLAPSFGATAVLIYAAGYAPMSQPRNVIGGHLVSATTSVIIYQLFGLHWWSITLAVTLAIFFMNITHTLHPPGGATAFIGVYTEQGFSFILFPIALGAILLVLVGVLVNNMSSSRKYPNSWL